MNIESCFNSIFSNWKISLPRDDCYNHRCGKLVKSDWVIFYLFGKDDTGKYLDYYASHRMTDDSHSRIYANGHRESLPSLLSFRLCSENPEEDAQLEAGFYAENKRIEIMLKEKGFIPSINPKWGLLGDLNY